MEFDKKKLQKQKQNDSNIVFLILTNHLFYKSASFTNKTWTCTHMGSDRSSI